MVDTINNLIKIEVFVENEDGITESHGIDALPKDLYNSRLNENFFKKVNDYFYSWLTDKGSPYRVTSVNIFLK